MAAYVCLALAMGGAMVAVGNELDVLVADDAPVPPGQILKSHLLGELRPLFAARRDEVRALATVEQFTQRQARVREDLTRIVGLAEPPERTPLNPRVVGRVERPQYVVEKVIYESRPGHRVTANLYLPRGAAGPFPGVLVPCGHSDSGKAAQQSVCALLARQGMAALSYDPIGQGERRQLLGPRGNRIINSTDEHTLTTVGGLLVGRGTAHYRIWDGLRSLDYLASRPEVDPQRLGCTGCSGGGTLTSYLMALDPRIAAAAPSCYLTTLERLFDTIGPQDGEQNLPGQVALGIDHADYIAQRAPRPTLMLVATRDFFDIDGAWTTFRETKRQYSLLGAGERIDLFESDTTHGYPKSQREAAATFFRRWLLGKPGDVSEPPLDAIPDAELLCTVSGQVRVDFPQELSVFDLHRLRADELAPRRQALWAGTRAEALATVRRLAGIRHGEGQPTATPRGAVPAGEGTPRPWAGRIERLLLGRAGAPPLPALLLWPTQTPANNAAGGAGEDKAARKHSVSVVAASEGKEADLGSEGLVAQRLAAGRLVLCVDVRGCGETMHGKRGPRQGLFGPDYQMSLLAMHAGRPLVAQRAEDLLTALDYLATRDDAALADLEVVATGTVGVAALHAAALDERVAALTLLRTPDSWSRVLAAPAGEDQLASVVPFALEAYDLSDLAASLAPRKATFATDPATAVRQTHALYEAK